MTGKELVAFCKTKLGTPYVYGMKGDVMTLKKYRELKAAYGNNVWDSDIKKVGQVCCDCSGLISWATGIQRGSSQYKETATGIFPIGDIANAPIGAALWKKGHIGVYIGNGKYIAEDGSAYGCRENKVVNSQFTHWLLLKDIDYEFDKEEKALTESETRRIIKEEIEEILKGKGTQVSDWAKDEWAEAIASQITDGTRPKGYATREEVAAMILRAER